MNDRYVKKAEVVHAWRVPAMVSKRDAWEPVPDWVLRGSVPARLGGWVVLTKGGERYAKPCDWIVQEAGEFSVFDDHTFAMNYSEAAA